MEWVDGRVARRTIEIFEAWLEHWRTRDNKQAEQVFQAWKGCRAQAGRGYAISGPLLTLISVVARLARNSYHRMVREAELQLI